MHQILFHIPFTAGWFPPDGVPLHGFGAMLFICFVITAMVWGPRRGVQIGLPKERLQDMAILLFVTGIAGARVVYIWQYYERDFKGKNLFVEFFKIWEGGIVFYGAAIGGLIGFLAFRHFVLKKLGVSTFKLLDVCAPLIAFGLAVGRIGCYLNGCCWGQVAVPESQPVPISAEWGHYPLLSGHGVREQVTTPPNSGTQLPQVWGLQTAVGFTTKEQPTVVHGLERGSEAEKVLRVGDRVLKVNGSPVYQLSVRGLPTEEVSALRGELFHGAAEDLGSYNDGFVLGYTSITEVSAAEDRVRAALRRESRDDKPKVSVFNSLDAASWPRWKKSLDLEVDRDGKKVSVSFTPRTVAVFPTQIYETVSMGLLTILLLAYQPFRRHDGQLIVLLMIGYGVHRWFNEAIRIEPTYAMGMTLSQWISVAIILGGVVLEVYLWKTQPRLPVGPVPLSYGAVLLPPPAK